MATAAPKQPPAEPERPATPPGIELASLPEGPLPDVEHLLPPAPGRVKNFKDEPEDLPDEDELFKTLSGMPRPLVTPTFVLVWLCMPDMGSYQKRQRTTCARLLYRQDPNYYNKVFRQMGFAVTAPSDPSLVNDMFTLWRIPPTPDETLSAAAANAKALEGNKYYQALVKDTEAKRAEERRKEYELAAAAAARPAGPPPPGFRKTAANMRAEADARRAAPGARREGK